MRGRVAVLCGMLVAGVSAAAASDHAQSQDRGAWFKSLRQPGTRVPCCDESDCHRTDADWRDGRWWAVVEGKWVPIPPNKIISVPSLDGNAYVCNSTLPTFIFCFVPPVMTM